ncbi:hypothetical protein JOM56_000629 [Amanita muscaria]
MVRSKRRRPEVDEYTYESSDDEKKPPSVLHRHTHVESLNGKRTTQQLLYTMPSSSGPGPTVTEAQANSYLLDNIGDDSTTSYTFDSFLSDMEAAGNAEGNARAKTRPRPLLQWIPEIDAFLQELLRHEGRGPAQSCLTCAMNMPSYRCMDCMNNGLYCKPCIVASHKSMPFHRSQLQEWTGRYFSRISLRELGLRIQLNHPYGENCYNPVKSYNDNFTVIDLNGIHDVAVDYCGCHLVQPHTIQLLRFQLYPATVIDPKTAATFQVLEFFHLNTLISKISAFDFYVTLRRRTDNTGTQEIPYRYPSFLLMARQWRHLKLLKQMGRGHHPEGRNGTREGECAVLCPACPQPGRNLPSNWAEAPPKQQWLYTLFLGLDANFRLKRLNISKNADDPDLNQGSAYFVNETSFQMYLQEYNSKIPNDRSTCSNYDAIKLASMRGGKGTATTGVGTVECIRHDMKRPASVGDLQKGERYVNMDYFFLSSIQQNCPRKLVVSYDIACQWSKNLNARIILYGPSRGSEAFQKLSTTTFAVPKAHLPVHQDFCKTRYSFNLLPRMGRTDGEAPERGWAATNAVASSTKEMGPGSRRDTLDDHFGDYNWKKVTNLATSLLNRFTEAVNAQLEHTTIFLEFSSALGQDNVSAWTKAIQEWECDQSNPNPYELKEKRISEAQVRLQLTMRDASGEDTTQTHIEITPSMLISQGLELEELQRRLRFDAKSIGSHATELQHATLSERSIRLRRRIEAWQDIQNLYMPGIAMLRVRFDQEPMGRTVPITASDIELMLPSHILAGLHHIHCDTRLIEIEWELRVAQASDILHELQRLLLIRRQRHHTRSIASIKTVQEKVDRAVKRYRETRLNLVILANSLTKVGWDDTLQPLQDKDVRAPDEEDSISEGRRTFTWIWRTGSVGKNDSAAQEVLRIEWCKARARAHRWQEECLLLKEEMRRVLQFFESEVSRWNSLAGTADFDDCNILEGRHAYAYRQANIRAAMRGHCARKWDTVSPERLVLAGDFKNSDGLVEYE